MSRKKLKKVVVGSEEIRFLIGPSDATGDANKAKFGGDGEASLDAGLASGRLVWIFESLVSEKRPQKYLERAANHKKTRRRFGELPK